MNSASKFIKKCRQRGFGDAQIMKSAAGKSATLRDDVLALLDLGKSSNIDERNIEQINDFPPEPTLTAEVSSVENTPVIAEILADIKLTFEEDIAVDFIVAEKAEVSEIASVMEIAEVVAEVIDDAREDDLSTSQALINAAYQRIETPIIETPKSEYIPPKLTVIDCAGENIAPEENIHTSDDVIILKPSYAINAQETAQRLKHLAQEIIEQPRVILPPAPTATELNELQEKLTRAERDLHESNDGAKMFTLEAEVLRQRVNTYEQELTLCHRDLCALREQSANGDNAIMAQSRAMSNLQDSLKASSITTDTLLVENESLAKEKIIYYALNNAYAFELGERNKMVEHATAQAQELSQRLETNNITLQHHENTLKDLHEKIASNEAAQQVVENRHQELQRDYNILQNETLPNLQSDKDDLVALVGEEIARAEQYDNIISLKSRRASYATTLAAAACVMMVLMPIFAWNNYDTKKMELTAQADAMMAQAEGLRKTLENERALLHDKVQAMQTALKKADSEKKAWASQMATLQTERQDYETRLAKLQNVENKLTDDVKALHGNAAVVQYNEVLGVREWQQQHAKNTATPANNRLTKNEKTITDGKVTERVAKVKRGEGLSQLLWRVYGRSSPELVQQIAKHNHLPLDARGNPTLQIGQEIRLPDNLSTASRE